MKTRSPRPLDEGDAGSLNGQHNLYFALDVREGAHSKNGYACSQAQQPTLVVSFGCGPAVKSKLQPNTQRVGGVGFFTALRRIGFII